MCLRGGEIAATALLPLWRARKGWRWSPGGLWRSARFGQLYAGVVRFTVRGLERERGVGNGETVVEGGDRMVISAGRAGSLRRDLCEVSIVLWCIWGRDCYSVERICLNLIFLFCSICCSGLLCKKYSAKVS